MEVIGNGMLAKAFRTAGIGSDRLVIFCSGVSDSKETLEIQFSREKNMLLDAAHHYQNSKIVYFSSCAAEFSDSPYYRFKRDMEALVLSSTQRFLIVRLPQVVGVTLNNTLISHLVRCIKEGRTITVTHNARRNLIDVEDVVRLTLWLSGLDNMQIGVTNGAMIAVEDLIDIISNILDKAANIEYSGIEHECSYDGTLLASLIEADDSIYAYGYNRLVLTKYIHLLSG